MLTLHCSATLCVRGVAPKTGKVCRERAFHRAAARFLPVSKGANLIRAVKFSP